MPKPPIVNPAFDVAPLTTSKPNYRRNVQYENFSAQAFGSLNLDANDATLEKGQLTDALNLRMTKPGEYELRSGYQNFPLTLTEPGTLLCKTEFRYKNYIFDVSVVFTEGVVKISAIANAPITGSAIWTTTAATLIPGTPTLAVPLPGPPSVTITIADNPPIAAATQYQNFIVVTIYDQGTYAFYPTGAQNTATQFDTWTVIPLGKSLCPTPWRVSYKDDHVDDLINFQYDLASYGNVIEYFIPKNNPLSSGNASLVPPYLYDRLKIRTPYTRAGRTGQPFNKFGTHLWQWNKHDSDAPQAPFSRGHLQTRAWGYRFVFIRSVSDGKGGKIVFRSQASADMWVPNNIYAPPQPIDSGLDKNGVGADGVTVIGGRPLFMECGNLNSYAILNSRGTASAQKYEETGAFVEPLINLVSRHITTLPAPLTGNADVPMVTFAKAIADYEGLSDDAAIVGVIHHPVYYPKTPFLYFTMWYAGWRICGDRRTDVGFVNGMKVDSGALVNGEGPKAVTPYWTEVPASFLAEAPLAVFSWDDFKFLANGALNPDFPSDITEIEVYRTAFSDGDAKTTDGDPLFQPHQYGYVGSIKANKTFTDDIKDAAVDFGKNPERYDGFLAGQFSGQAIRKYNRKLVIGNTSTQYWADAPAPFVMQAFVFEDFLHGHYSRSDLAPTSDVVSNAIDVDPSDGKPNKYVQFFYSYVDQEGNESDLAKVYVEVTNTGFLEGTVGFVLGQGYSPYISAVRLYKSACSAGGILPRTYTLIKEIDVNDGYYYSYNDETALSFYDTSGNLVTATTIKPGKHMVDGTPGGKRSRDPGAVNWSNTYAPFDWDPLHSEVISTEAPITYLDSLIGELWIWTDRGVHLSNIDNFNPRGEEESEEVGCIGRFAAVKVDKVVFFLSSGGLYFAESSGVHPFPGLIQTEILKYVNEQITGKPDLANIRRATIGYNKKRQELYIYLPSSADLGGTLAEKLFVFKFFSDDIDAASIRRHVNYQFELLDPLAPADPALAFTQLPIIFQPHSDGRLFVSFGQTAGNKIHTLDLDVGAWTGRHAIELTMGLIDLNVVKMLREVEVSGDFNCGLSVYTGIANAAHVPDYSDLTYPRGLVNSSADRFDYTLPANKMNIKLRHVVSGSLWNTTANAPVVRITGRASGGNNIARYKALDVWYQFIHEHQ